MKHRLLLIFSLFILVTTGRMAAQGDIYPEVIQVLISETTESTIIDLFIKQRGYSESTLDCLKELPLDYFNASSRRGAEVYFNEDKQLVYFHRGEGDDIVTITVDGCDVDRFELKLFVMESADNIEVAECVGDPQEGVWAIKEDWTSTENGIATYVSPVIGDLSGDGIPEIVVAKFVGGGGDPYRKFQNLYVYDGKSRKDSGYKPIEIVTPDGNYMPAGPIGLVNVGIPLIVMIGGDGCLYAYSVDFENKTSQLEWKSEETIIAGYNQKIHFGSVAFADFNNDGAPEIYVANRIFDAGSGQLLVDGPSDGTKGESHTFSTAYQYMPSVADIDGDGTLEYIAGTKIYKVDIWAGKMTEYFDIGPISIGSSSVKDGITMLADFNKDGYLDVVLLSTLNGSTTSISIWDIKNKKVLGSTSFGSGGSYFVGIPFIGDVDADGDLEIMVTSIGTVNGFRWNSETGAITSEYSLGTTDSSGSTGITLFDFNQSGQPQLVYRDEKTLRILKAEGNSFKDLDIRTGVCSGTFYESAVVADVDDDGQAEIITVGHATSSGSSGTLRVFKSGNNFAWAPARKVWNQYAYNVVNVNDDLTIPRYRMNQARIFSYDEDGNPRQPYNNSLQQQTVLDQKGKPFRPLPHAVWIYEPKYTRQEGEITLYATIENIGDVDLDIPVSIVMYADEIDADNIIGQKDYTGEGGKTVLEPGQSLDIEVSFPLNDEKSLSRIIITVNDMGKEGAGEIAQDQCSFVSQDIIYFVQAKDDHIIKEGIPEETLIPVFDNDFLGEDKEKDKDKTKFELILPDDIDGTYTAEEDWGTVNLGKGIYPQYGTISFDDNYNVIYTPFDPETFPGRDEFTYKLVVEDNNSYLIDEATVVIEYIRAKDNSYALSDYGKTTLQKLVIDDDELLKDPDDITQIDSERPVTVILPDEGDNDLLMPQLGTLTLDSENQTKVYYTPNGKDGLDVFEYQISYENPYIYPEDAENPEPFITSTAKVYIWVLNEDRITCDDTEAITLDVPDGAEFAWYDTETSNDVLETENGTLFINNQGDDDEVLTSKEVWVAMNFKPDGENDMFEDKRIKVRVRFLPVHMYWNQSAQDNDWNNYENWTNEKGEVFDPLLEFLPSECTIVHIPGDASNYPELTKGGNPTCDQIIFHYGGEVARPELLTYNKAFVHYNVGYYDEKGELQNGDPLSSAPMERDRWYGLAVPLKKVATGDFSFGGWPNTWQMAFERNTVGSDWIGEFTKPFSTNGTELGNNYAYSYALWVNDYSFDRGSSNQNGLNAVKGIIELPYYENEEASKAHRIHSYNPSNKTSSFQYYYWQVDGMPLVPAGEKEFGTVDRGNKDEAYRFVFDGNTRESGGRTIFEIRLTGERGKEIMVGNPMMSTLDFNAFYNANSSYIENYYRLYDGNSGTFETYEYNVGSAGLDEYISPLQAFFVSTKGTGNLVLTFPFENVSVTRPIAVRNPLKSSAAGTGKTDVLYVVAENEAKKTSSVTLALRGSLEEDVPALFYSGTTDVAQMYFVNETGRRNSVQYSSYGQETKLGYLMNNPGKITLRFNNLDNIYASSLLLVDQWTGKEQNLLTNPVYSFESTGSSFTDRFLLKVGDRTKSATSNVPITIDPKNWYVHTYHQDNNLMVQSTEIIDKIQVYDLQGILCISVGNVGARDYVHPMDRHGTYIVKVITVDGQEKICKVIL